MTRARGRLRDRQWKLAADRRSETRVSTGSEAPPSLAAAVALVVAAFAAVGVSGGFLGRAVRNEPYAMAAIIIGALAAAAAPTIVAVLRGGRRALAVSLSLLALVAMIAVLIGAASMAVREQPLLVLSANTTAGATAITVKARASGLRSDEDMLVQIQAMEVDPDSSSAPTRLACATPRLQSSPDPEADPPWPGPLLLWQQTGPDESGVVDVESVVELEPGPYRGVCGYAGLRTRGDDGDARFVSTYLRIPAIELAQDGSSSRRDAGRGDG